MGELVKLPNCRELSPELLRCIERRTKTPAYWVRYWAVYWAVVRRITAEMYEDEVNERGLEDVWLRVVGWLHDRNRAAIKARGF